MKISLLFLVVTLLLPAAASAADHPAAATSNLLETLEQEAGLSTLATAVRAAGLAEALEGPGPLTLFAPTDDAFGALPEGTLASLLEPQSKPRLVQILKLHVVPGRVPASSLLPSSSVSTLAGETLPLGLRVGDATVIRTDIACANGVIHVIDAVILPSPKTAKATASGQLAAGDVLRAAIARGAPLYNAGDHAACAATYMAAARMLLDDHASSLGALHRMDLRAALDGSQGANATDQAWALRRAFDRVLADLAFEPRMEAPLPEGFPGPGPVGRVVEKSYPGYRAARAEGRNPFWTLFQHIQKNDVQMTAPVEMTVDGDLRALDMAFLYESPAQGQAGADGSVRVLDLQPTRVLSIGMRGERDQGRLDLAKAALEEAVRRGGFETAGPWRLMGYNSPMVPADERFWELQVPIRR